MSGGFVLILHSLCIQNKPPFLPELSWDPEAGAVPPKEQQLWSTKDTKKGKVNAVAIFSSTSFGKPFYTALSLALPLFCVWCEMSAVLLIFKVQTLNPRAYRLLYFHCVILAVPPEAKVLKGWGPLGLWLYISGNNMERMTPHPTLKPPGLADSFQNTCRWNHYCFLLSCFHLGN